MEASRLPPKPGLNTLKEHPPGGFTVPGQALVRPAVTVQRRFLRRVKNKIVVELSSEQAAPKAWLHTLNQPSLSNIALCILEQLLSSTAGTICFFLQSAPSAVGVGV